MAITVVATADPATGGITVTATMSASITAVTIGRNDPNGFSQLIRQGASIPVTGGTVTVVDYEAPLDVEVSYVVSQLTPVGSEVGYSANVKLASEGRTWLKDPGYPGRNMVIPVVTSIADLTRPARAGIFNVIDRANPVVVATRRGGPGGILICHTLTLDQRDELNLLLSRGTTLLLQTPVIEQFGSAYVAVTDAVETRVGLAFEESRRFTLPFVVVDRPDGLASASTVDKTWRALKNKYLTWGDQTATGKTYQQVLESGP